MTFAKTLFAAAAALAAGAAAMYYLDPQSGRRRRALVADRAEALRHDAARLAVAKGRRAADRARGLVAGLRSVLPGQREVADDGQIAGRVRAHLGRVVGYPKAIHTTVDQGCVRLDGHILESDLHPLLSELKTVPGVRRIYNRLEVHEKPEHDPSLQGARVYHGRRRFARPLMWSALAVAAPIALAIGAAQRYNGAGRP
jgi:hypothetical protein